MRAWAARLLLSVFLPIVMLSSLHVHEHATGDGDCFECVNHLPHGGHISLQTASLHDCVLCQFVSLSYVAAVTLTMAMAGLAHTAFLFSPSSQYLSAARHPHSPRAPPVI